MVEFNNVTFSYPGGSGVPAIKNLSFYVPAGKSLAVIGPTGSREVYAGLAPAQII